MGYTQTVYTTTEGEGMVKLCANISSPIGGIAPRPFVLNSTTFDGTAGTCIYVHYNTYNNYINKTRVFNEYVPRSRTAAVD